MVFGTKENKFLVPYRIFRGIDAGDAGVDIPIPKTGTKQVEGGGGHWAVYYTSPKNF